MKRNYQVFEYDKLIFSKEEKSLKEALDSFYGENGVPYYDLIRNGIRFKQFVGVLQVGPYTIEVLPKVDKTSNEINWQHVLIQMLRQSGILETDAPTSSDLRLRSNSILDLYIELFINQCEYLLKRGLVKKYHKEEGNKTALKGALVFSKHLTKNIIHKERFWVRHSVYDSEYKLNQVLLKTLRLLQFLPINSALKGRLAVLSLDFPDLPDIYVNEAFFSKIRFDRKSSSYKKAISIARMLLLNYHPDIRTGRNNVLALMFDMNKLWEKWVYKRLQKINAGTVTMSEQNPMKFWTPIDSSHYSKTLRPDILVEGDQRIVLDTKWKLPKDQKPSDDDLKQMFAYNKRFNSNRSILVYPGTHTGYSGKFFEDHGQCEVYFLDILEEGKLSDQALIRLYEHLN